MGTCGQPTKYREEHCEKFVSLRKQGYSVDRIAAEWDISKQTIYNWTKDNPLFLDAYARGDAKYHAYLESLAMANVHNPKFNDRIFRMLAAKSGWSDKSADNCIPHPGLAKNPSKVLIEELQDGKISASVFDSVHSGLTKQFDRENVTKVLEAAETLKEFNKKNNQ